MEKTSTSDFGFAIKALKQDKRVARTGWNGKGMWLCLVHDWDMPDSKLPRLIDDLETLSWIGMKTADNKFVPWLASQTDVLAEDWLIV